MNTFKVIRIKCGLCLKIKSIVFECTVFGQHHENSVAMTFF